MDAHWYYTYIVASRTHVLNVGFTGNLEDRIWKHKNKVYEGFASEFNCNRLVWFEIYSSPITAIAREKQLKGWRRSKKIWLIEKENPAWVDLSEEWYKQIKN